VRFSPRSFAKTRNGRLEQLQRDLGGEDGEVARLRLIDEHRREVGGT
jgi:hypothetical protein